MAGRLGKFAFFEGEIRPYGDAKISVGTHAFNYGTACFEGIRFFWNESKQRCAVLALQEHFQRLLQSCKVLKINLPYNVGQLAKITTELLLRENFKENGYIRPIAYKKDEVIGVRLTRIADDLTIFTTTFGSYYRDEEDVRAIITSVQRVDDCAIPARAKITGSYVNSALAKDEAIVMNFDEAIVLNAKGRVSEASAANLFIVRKGLVITPPVSENILEGITRDIVMMLAEKELGKRVLERPIDRSELFVAEEVFITGTACNISAITHINGQPVGNGKMGVITGELREIYFRLIQENLPKYSYLITPV